MHRSMTKEVIKRLVVAIKRMETDLNFYENNWHLFQSANLDYIKSFQDMKIDSAEKSNNPKDPEIMQENN